jgi:hypothetical protein
MYVSFCVMLLSMYVPYLYIYYVHIFYFIYIYLRVYISYKKR